MKRSIYVLLFAFVTIIGASSCIEKTTDEKVEEVGDDVEEGVEEVGDEIEDATDDNLLNNFPVKRSG